MKAELACLVLVLSTSEARAAVSVVCPDGRKYVAADPAAIRCVEVCPDGTWGVRGEIFCKSPAPPPTAEESASRAAKSAVSDAAFKAVSLIVALVGAAAAVAVLFLPISIAVRRKHHNRLAIAALTVIAVAMPAIGALASPAVLTLAGIGGSPLWLVALIWSLTAIRRD